MLGVALEGGGAKGAYHIGALKALSENGYKIDGVVGTSIGAFNAALLAQGDFEQAYELWVDIEPSTLFDVEDAYMKKLVHAEVNRDTIKYLSSKTKEIIGNKGIDTSRLRKVLDQYIDEEKLRKSPIDFGLVTVSLSDLKPVQIYKEAIPEGMIKDYIMASASFPGFKVDPINGKHYIDGGIHDNCPINLLSRKGYTDIIAIRTNQKEKLVKVNRKDVNILNIIPSEELGKSLIFDNNLIRKNILMGYYDTIRVIRGLKGRKYCIEPYEEDVFFSILANIPEEIILQIGEVLKFPKMDSRRMLFEKIMPMIADLLKLSITASYQDIFIGLLEVIAEEKGIKRFKIYTMQSFIDGIESTSSKEAVEIRTKRHLSNLKKLATQLLGRHMLDEIAYVILDTVPLDTFKIENTKKQ